LAETRRCFDAIAPQLCSRSQEGLELNETHQLLVYPNDFNLLVKYVNAIEKIIETLIDINKEVVGMEVNTGNIKNMFVSSSECRTKS
jgi:hypothetical protein